ncbi:MAG TPA: SBBP repeat-containing protein [Candidatus Binataceae bacterium]|nr:SBBP repeat-containing protein [Candidatus Binataceae bacterium]
MNRPALFRKPLSIAVLSVALIAATSYADSSHAPGSVQSANPGAANKARIANLYGKIPLSFERNDGQTDRQVKFLSRGNGYTLFLTANEAVLTLRKPEPKLSASNPAIKNDRKIDSSPKSEVIRMRLIGANPKAKVEGLDPLPGKSNYFIGSDPKKWHANVPTYAKVRYRNIYPGIDMVYYGTDQHELEYDFVLAPGADPKAIKLRFDGAKQIALSPNGDMSIRLADGGEIVHRAPFIYQERDGKREKVDGRCMLRDKDTIGFKLAAYDRTRPVYIDPALVYSTYLGGSGGSGGFDSGNAITVDSAGNTYVTGRAGSIDFPATVGAFQTINKAAASNGPNAFVAKFNASGTALIYSTYLGGSAGDFGNGIAVDSAGSAYATGSTSSPDFPTAAGAFQTTLNGTENAFVTKLNPSGSALAYSTYLGGTGGVFGSGDFGSSIAVDSTGSAYVTGTAYSLDFPTTVGAFQTANNGIVLGVSNGFVTKLNAAGSGLVYSSYLGGGGTCGFEGPGPSTLSPTFGDSGSGIVIDSAGFAYVTGTTYSLTYNNFCSVGPDFPTTPGAYQILNANLDGLADPSQVCTDIGTPWPCCAGAGNGASCTPASGPNAFVTKVSVDGTALVYSTYLGGSGVVDVNGGSDGDYGTGIAIDSGGNAYVTGGSASSDFPVTAAAFQSSNHATGGGTDAFAAKLNATGTALAYSSYLGGHGACCENQGNGIALDTSGDAYVAGVADSNDFPTTPGAFQTTLGGGGSAASAAFVSKFDPTKSGNASLLYSTYLGGSNRDEAFGIAVDAAGSAYLTGYAESSDFPTTSGAFQTSLTNSHGSAFISKFAIPSMTTSASYSTGGATTSLNYPPAAVGDTAVKSITVNNTGATKPLYVEGAQSSDPAEYAVASNTCPISGLAPGGNCSIGIGFTPSHVANPIGATLTIFENNSSGTTNVPLAGSGVTDLALSPGGDLTYPSIPWGTLITLNVTVENFRTTPVTLTGGINFAGANGGDFSVVAATAGTDCGGTAAAGSATSPSKCNIGIKFTPGALNAESASLNVSGSPAVPLGPVTIALSAGKTIPATVSPPISVIFGSLSVSKAQSQIKSVTITNNANVSISIGPNSITSGAANYSIGGGSCGSVLAGGSSCTVNVAFTPTVVGSPLNGTVSIADGPDPKSPRSIILSGNGIP